MSDTTNRFESLRAMVARWLTDTCTIREAGEPTYDPDLGYDTVADGAVIYSGACRLRPTGGERVVMAGEAPVTLRLYDLTLPHDITSPKIDHVGKLTDSSDGYMVDRRWRLIDVQGGTDGVYRRCIVEEVL